MAADASWDEPRSPHHRYLAKSTGSLPATHAPVDETAFHWNGYEGGRVSFSDDALGSLPELQKHVDSYVGVREEKETWLHKFKVCNILRKLKCHLNSNLYSIPVQPEWSWDRNHYDLAYKLDCAGKWERNYGSVLGLLASLALMIIVLVFSIYNFVTFLQERSCTVP